MRLLTWGAGDGPIISVMYGRPASRSPGNLHHAGLSSWSKLAAREHGWLRHLSVWRLPSPSPQRVDGFPVRRAGWCRTPRDDGRPPARSEEGLHPLGGLKVLHRLLAHALEGRPEGPHRPERRQQDDRLQRAHGCVPPTEGDVVVAGTRVNGKRPFQINRPRRRAHLPEHPALQGAHRARQREASPSSPTRSRWSRASSYRRGAAGSMQRAVGAALTRSTTTSDWWRAPSCGTGGLPPAKKGRPHEAGQPAARGDGPVEPPRRDCVENCLRRRPAPVEVARALGTNPVLLLDRPAAGRHEHAREGVDLDGADPPAARPFSLGIPAHRARHEAGDGICEHITVLDHGETIALVGTPAKTRQPWSSRRTSGPVQQPSLRRPAPRARRCSTWASPAPSARSRRHPGVSVGKGRSGALIGANGAGKTSTLRPVSGCETGEGAPSRSATTSPA